MGSAHPRPLSNVIPLLAGNKMGKGLLDHSFFLFLRSPGDGLLIASESCLRIVPKGVSTSGAYGG